MTHGRVILGLSGEEVSVKPEKQIYLRWILSAKVHLWISFPRILSAFGSVGFEQNPISFKFSGANVNSPDFCSISLGISTIVLLFFSIVYGCCL
jgi:hypothetical protein